MLIFEREENRSIRRNINSLSEPEMVSCSNPQFKDTVCISRQNTPVTKEFQKTHQLGSSRIFVLPPPSVESHLDVYANGYQICTCVKHVLSVVLSLRFSIHF